MAAVVFLPSKPESISEEALLARKVMASSIGMRKPRKQNMVRLARARKLWELSSL